MNTSTIKTDMRKIFEKEFSYVGWIPENKQRHINFLDFVIDQTGERVVEEVNKALKRATLDASDYDNGWIDACEEILRLFPTQSITDTSKQV